MLVQTFTYLFCVCLFSIAFLVFLNSSLSFVITDLIGDKTGVGDAVGTLGFADELFALFTCRTISLSALYSYSFRISPSWLFFG